MFITLLYIVVVFLLVAANGFFVASEFALVAVRRSRIVLLAEEGDRRAKILLELTDNLSAYISATQLGITMASLALGWIGEPAFADLLEAPLRGRVSVAVKETIAFALAFTTITCLHIVLGELAPKTLALERTEKIALAIARPMHLFHTVFRWPVRLLDWAGTQTVRFFGLHPSGHVSVYTSEELRHLIDTSRQSGSIEPDEQSLLHGVFEFADTAVREVIVPRSDVEALPATATLDEAKAAFRTSGYSRMPVYRDQLDNIVGVVYRRDLEPFLEAPPAEPFHLEKLLHRAKFIPSGAQLSAALRQMQVSRTHLAVVVDEYGGVEGIVTLEDLLEQIVGEIGDEYDEEALPHLVQEADGSYLMDGMLTVRALNIRLNLRLPEDPSYTTIAGFLLAQTGHLMNVGESVEHEAGCFTVESLDGRRIERVRFTPPKPEES